MFDTIDYPEHEIIDRRPIWLMSETLRANLLSELALCKGPLIELGAGAGNLTQSLVDVGKPEHELVLIEADRQLTRLLRRRFPEALVLNRDATCLAVIDFYVRPQAGAIVSSLPFQSMPSSKIQAILNAAFLCAAPGTAFYQLSASLACPIPEAALDRLGLVAERIHPVSTRRTQPSVFCGISARDEAKPQCRIPANGHGRRRWFADGVGRRIGFREGRRSRHRLCRSQCAG